MWRYYELLTDVKVPQIEQMKADATSGKQHPMQLKKALARRIVQDFHGEQAAAAADENWAKQFQKDEVPEDIENQTIAIKDVSAESDGQTKPSLRVDKLILLAGLAESSTDAQRKRKQKAVKIDDRVIEEHAFNPDSREFVLKVGRKIKRITLV
jgi:tyrosyl-tRNA synthetase